MDWESERCRREIEAVEAELLPRDPDIEGLVLALSGRRSCASSRTRNAAGNKPGGAM